MCKSEDDIKCSCATECACGDCDDRCCDDLDDCDCDCENSSKVSTLEDAIEFSKKEFISFLTETLLVDPKNNKPMFVYAPPYYDEKQGTISIICASELEPEEFVVHKIYSAYATKSQIVDVPEEPEPKEESSIIHSSNIGKIIDLNGNPLN